MVLKAGLKLPTWVLLDPKYDGLSAEQVYRIRQQQRQQQQQGREGQAYHSQRGDDGEKPGNSGQNEPADVGDNLEPNNKSNNYREEGGEEPHDDDLDTGGKLGEEPSGSERSTTGVRSCADSSIPAREKITLGRDRTVGFSRPD